MPKHNRKAIKTAVAEAVDKRLLKVANRKERKERSAAAGKRFRRVRRMPAFGRPKLSGIDYAARFALKSIAPIQQKLKNGAIRVRGRDLVQSTSLLGKAVSDNGIFQIIPSNPSLWEGTRLAALAQGYQYFKPTRFVVYYIPQVPVTTAGTVAMGTLWQNDQEVGNIQQTLVTSNGGILTQIYSSACSQVTCGKDLPQRNYNMFGNTAEVLANPFNWMALINGTAEEMVTPPGFVFVDWEYILSNAQGESGQKSKVVAAEDAPKAAVRYAALHAHVDYSVDGIFSGIAIGLLKTLAAPLLDKVACFLLKGTQTLVGKINYGVGKMVNWSHENVTDNARTNDTTTVVVDPATGEQELVDDNTQVIAYMTGRTIGNATPPDPHYASSVNITPITTPAQTYGLAKANFNKIMSTASGVAYSFEYGQHESSLGNFTLDFKYTGFEIRVSGSIQSFIVPLSITVNGVKYTWVVPLSGTAEHFDTTLPFPFTYDKQTVFTAAADAESNENDSNVYIIRGKLPYRNFSQTLQARPDTIAKLQDKPEIQFATYLTTRRYDEFPFIPGTPDDEQVNEIEEL